MTFLHVVYATIHKLQYESFFMSQFLKMKFKMKLGYSCFINKMPMKNFVIKSIRETVDEKV